MPAGAKLAFPRLAAVRALPRRRGDCAGVHLTPYSISPEFLGLIKLFVGPGKKRIERFAGSMISDAAAQRDGHAPGFAAELDLFHAVANALGQGCRLSRIRAMHEYRQFFSAETQIQALL